MKEVFKYTFLSIAEWKKFLILVLSVSILTLVEAFPVVSIAAFLFEKLIFLSVGVFLIYLIKRSSTPDIYYENLSKNHISTFFFHFIPSASGILVALLIIMSFWLFFAILILKYTNSLFVIANPHNFVGAFYTTSTLTKILFGFYSVYLMFYSYIFLGKFGEALSKETFKESFISMILSLFDFKYWIKTVNLRYFLIYLIWSIITITIYSLTSFVYIFNIFPTLQTNPNLSLLIIPIFVAIVVIISYFTYFSAYFAHKTTN